MRALIVDDEVAKLNILQTAVHWGKAVIDRVYTAENAMVAREILTAKNVDIVLCDIEMPGESGLELIEWIQGLYPNIVNIILTGYPDFNYARHAISLGVYEYLLKPVAFDELEATLAKAVNRLLAENQRNVEKDGGREQPESMVAQIRAYLEKHYNEVVTRNDIESLVHMNKDYINREFKRETGYSLMEYIQYYRVLIAKKLLSETQDSISQISAAVGYDSQAYFSKIFKQRVGMTPWEVRNGPES